jgi:hypothetical protein
MTTVVRKPTGFSTMVVQPDEVYQVMPTKRLPLWVERGRLVKNLSVILGILLIEFFYKKIYNIIYNKICKG